MHKLHASHLVSGLTIFAFPTVPSLPGCPDAVTYFVVLDAGMDCHNVPNYFMSGDVREGERYNLPSMESLVASAKSAIALINGLYLRSTDTTGEYFDDDLVLFRVLPQYLCLFKGSKWFLPSVCEVRLRVTRAARHAEKRECRESFYIKPLCMHKGHRRFTQSVRVVIQIPHMNSERSACRSILSRENTSPNLMRNRSSSLIISTSPLSQLNKRRQSIIYNASLEICTDH